MKQHIRPSKVDYSSSSSKPFQKSMQAGHTIHYQKSLFQKKLRVEKSFKNWRVKQLEIVAIVFGVMQVVMQAVKP